MKTLRAEQQLSQEALADLADLDRTYVSSLERGLNRATLEVVGCLASAFGLSELDLMTRIVQQPPRKK
jgi:transcriptional regulator with XRE-family HTH domain